MTAWAGFWIGAGIAWLGVMIHDATIEVARVWRGKQ